MKKQFKTLPILLVVAIASCSPSVITSIIDESTTSSSVDSGTTSSVITSSSQKPWSSLEEPPEYPETRTRWGKYVLKEGLTDTSDFNGAPWLNVHKEGVINMIEQPSYKDDFYTAANYEYLQDITVPEGQEREGGVAVGNDYAVEECLDTIYEDPKTGLPALHKALNEGAKEAANQEITRLYNLSMSEALALINSDYLFKGYSKFITIEHRQSNNMYTLVNYPQQGGTGKWANVNLVKLVKQLDIEELAKELYYLAGLYGNTCFTENEIRVLLSSLSSLLSTPYGRLKQKVSKFKNMYDYNVNLYEALKTVGFSDDTEILLDSSIDSFCTHIGDYLNSDRTILSRLLALNKVFEYRFYLGAEDYIKFNKTIKEQYCGYISVNDFSTAEELYEYIEDMYLEEYANRLYVERFVTDESRARVATMIQEIKDEYKNLFLSYTWLSNETKATLIDKLESMKSIVFYEDGMDGLQIPDTDLSNLNVIQAMDAIEGYLAKAMGSGYIYTSTTKLNLPPYYTDAFYAPRDNYFLICHGEGCSYLNREDLSDEELYAYMGTVVGHEITHAFDSNGSKLDKNGNEVEIFSGDDRAKYDEKVTKLKDYISNEIVVLNGRQCFGDKWNAELTADMGGLKLAYLACTHKENFNFDKFFRCYAHYFAYIATDNFISSMITNSHPIGYVRVNCVLSQSQEFIDYYKLKEGDMMYTSPDNIVAIW